MHNLYVSRVYSEHPIALWNLDHGVSYLSLIDEDDRDLSQWTLSNLDVDIETTPVDGATFKDSTTVVLSPLDDENLTASLTSADLWASGDIVDDIPVAASFYLKLNDPSIEYIDFGSTDGTNESTTRNYFPTAARGVWVKVSTTVDYPKLLIRINFKAGQSVSALTWYINGLTLGQYSESTSSTSLGKHATTPTGTEAVIVSGAIPDDPSVSYHEMKSIGVGEKSGYFVIEDNRLLAYNTGLPMVYGANSLTRLVPSATPSLVFDGCGAFNDLGKNDIYTVEFWLKVGGSTITPKKIFGPVDSSDGLYIGSSVMTIVFGGHIASYDVGIFTEPMLVHIRLTEGFAGLVINGEEVAELNFNPNTVTWPTIDKDWLGFWSHADLDPIEIDCFSIFGYLVPTIVAKRRFVWGQGVGDVGVINSLYQGETAYSDFSTVRAAANISYPNNSPWQQGHYQNIEVINNKLAVSDLPLPDIAFETMDKDTWYKDSAGVQGDEPHFTFRPTSPKWYGENVAVRFNNIDEYLPSATGIIFNWSILESNESMMTYDEFEDMNIGVTYADFEADPQYEGVTYADLLNAGDYEPEPILLIRQKSKPGRMLYVFTDMTNLIVQYIDEIGATELYRQPINIETRYTTYINFNASTQSDINSAALSSELKSLLQNVSDIEIVLGNDANFTFSGKIFNFSFVNGQFVTESVDGVFNSTSLFNNEEYTVEHQALDLCPYTWLPKFEFGVFYEDIGIVGAWEDYIPLSKLATRVYDIFGNQAIGLDSIQFNMGHVRPMILLPDTDPGAQNYGGVVYRPYDTSNNLVRTYVAFQKTTDQQKSYLDMADEQIYSPTELNVVYAQALDYLNHLIEVVDGVVIIPPQNKRPDQLSLSVIVKFKIPGIKTYPIAVNTLEFASFAKNRNSHTPIGTRHGKNIYPYTSNGSYYDFMANNPFRVDKRGYPYLYLGRESGFVLDGAKQQGWDRGIQMPILNGVNGPYSLDSLQFWVRRNDEFPVDPIKVAELSYSTSRISFMLQSYQNDRKRGVMFAVNEAGQPMLDVLFFQNGMPVTRPVFSIGEWNVIQASIGSDGVALDGQRASFSIFAGLVFNNLSYFAVKPALGATSIAYRTWGDIDNETWQHWSQFTWSEILVLGSVTAKSKELSQIVYNTYTGQQVIRIDGRAPLRFYQGEILWYEDTQWSSETLIPV